MAAIEGAPEKPVRLRGCCPEKNTLVLCPQGW